MAHAMPRIQKMLFAVSASPGLPRAQALKHLRKRHAPLLCAATTNRQRLKTYIQNYAVHCVGVPGVRLDRDWIIESWRDPAVILPEPPVAADAILVREDEARFPDRASVMAMDVVERAIWHADAAAPFSTMPFKVFSFFRKPAGLSRSAFLERWDAAARALSENAAFREHAVSYVRNVTVPGVARPAPDPTAAPVAHKRPAYAGVDVWRFGSKAAIGRLMADTEFVAALRVFEGEVAAPRSLVRLVVLENKIFDDACVDAAIAPRADFNRLAARPASVPRCRECG